MNDFAWVIWTRSFGKLPTKGVNLKEINAEAEQLLAQSQTGSSQVAGVAEVPIGTIPLSSTTTPTSTASIGSGVGSTATNDQTIVRTASGKFMDKNVLEQVQQHSKNAVKVSAIKLITHCRNPELGPNAFTEEESQLLIDLVLKDDSYIISLYSNFKDDPLTFAKYCKKKATELKQLKSVQEVIKAEKEEAATDKELVDDTEKRKIEKQRKVEMEEQERTRRDEDIRRLVNKTEQELREKTEPGPGPGQKPPINTSSTETTKSGAVATF
jgi:hypothetical protein